MSGYIKDEDSVWREPEDDSDYECNPVFVGPCTCEHKAEEHGWQKCDADSCDCQAHWEE